VVSAGGLLGDSKALVASIGTVGSARLAIDRRGRPMLQTDSSLPYSVQGIEANGTRLPLAGWADPHDQLTLLVAFAWRRRRLLSPSP
jgi:hypothetical protein